MNSRSTPRRTITVSSPTDLLALVPCVLGFHPEDSVVMVTVGRAGSSFHARVDLPDDPDELPLAVEQVADAARRNEVRRAAVVIYSDDEYVAEAAFDALRAALEADGAEVVEGVRADGRRWYSLRRTGPCRPAEGTAYDLSSHPLTAQSVLDGRVTLPDRQALVDSLVGSDPEALAAVEEAVEGHARALAGSTCHPLGPPVPDGLRHHLVREGYWVADRVRAFLRDGRAPDHTDAGRLLVALASIEIRDVAWAEMTRENAPRHVDLWRDLVRRAPFDLVAPPAALLGFAAWLSGDGALAWCAVDRCQEADPGYRLAGLLTQALAGAVPPSSWSPVPRSELTLFAS